MHSDPQVPLVVFFGHPDDEFAVFPWLQQAVGVGRDVHCLWLTDGGWGGQDVARRRRESVRVLLAMGVQRVNMHFVGEELGLRDGGLYLDMDVAIRHVAAWSASLQTGAEFLVPAWEGGHQDHDASHLIGLAVAKKVGAIVYQYSLYQGAGLKGPFFRIMTPLPANGPIHCLRTSARQRMQCVLRCFQYRSQWKSFIGLLPFYSIRLLKTDAFALQAMSLARTSERPHDGALLYERRGGPSWAEFALKTRPYRQY